MHRIARLLFGILWLAATPAHAQLADGDLVVTDLLGLRVWQVRPSSNQAVVFSPPPGGVNLLTAPSDVATTSNRGVYVADGTRIVRIDPDTGVQQVLTRTLFDPIGGGIDIVPIVWEGRLSGIDSDENDALWVIEDRDGLPGRLWQVTSGLLGWSRTLRQETDDLGAIRNGLAVTSDEEGDANDVFFPTSGGRVLNVDVGTGNTVPIVDIGSIAGFEVYKGGIDAVGDCEGLLCTVLWTGSAWLSGFPPCLASDVEAFTVVAIIAGVAPLLEGMGGCAGAIAARTASDLYVSIMDLDPFSDFTPGVHRVFSLPSGFTSELVAELPGYGPGGGLPTSGMAIVVPAPGAGTLGAAALAALAARARRAARAQPASPASGSAS